VIELANPDWLEQFVDEGAKRFYETWSPPTPDLLEDVRALGVANRAAFVVEVDRLRERLEPKE
jgi:hypothetical protein